METNGILLKKNYLICNGLIVNPDKSEYADIATENGKIIAIGKLNPSEYAGFEYIDASGKLILPGGIDPHVHFALPTPAGNSCDDFLSGSLAALSGGTSSIIDFVTPKRGQSLIEACHFRLKEAESALCSYKLHMGISEWNETVKQEVIQCIRELGIKSFKAYLAYKTSIGISVDDLRQLMMVVGKEGGLVLVHCEEGDKISQLQQKYICEGKTHAAYHALSRPPETEINAINQVIRLSEETSCPVYIVHISTAEGARNVRLAKEKGLKVYGETCIQYLMLNDEVYNLEKKNIDVFPFVISPPIRSEENRLKLWEELQNGAIDTIATDHCPFNTHGQKDKGLEDFTKIPNGAGGVEFRMGLIYTYGVLTRKISLQEMVKLTSTNAATIFGWGDNKGKLKVGFDADLLIWDPEPSGKISSMEQSQRCDSNIYEGIILQGMGQLI
jgi:dihydropyrimidinase